MKIKDSELLEVAKAFCEKINATLIYVNEYEIGYETKNGALTHKSWYEIAKILANLEKEV
jgi:hypothetical protein